MTRIDHKLRLALGLVFAVTAIAAPAAVAAPVEPVGPNPTSDNGQLPAADDQGYSSVTALTGDNQPAPAPVTASASSGFDWGDAGIGASAMLALVAIAGGAAIATGHGPRRRHGVA
jgi:hypothetical protein